MDLEKTILGALWLDKDNKCIEEINNKAFLNEDVRYLVENLILAHKDIRNDIVSAKYVLKQVTENSVHYLKFLLECVNEVTEISQIESHINIINKEYRKREIKLITDKPKLNDEDLVLIRDLAQDTDSFGLEIVKLGDCLVGFEDEALKRKKLYKNGPPISTGFPEIDKYTGGIQKSILTLLGGFPGTGKTTLLTNWSVNAIKAGVPVLYITAEMNATQITDKIISSEAAIEFYKIRYGTLDNNDFKEINEMIQRNNLYDKPLNISYMPTIKMGNVKKAIDKTSSQVIIIDYFQLIETYKDKVKEFEQAGIELRKIAKERDIAIIAGSQFNEDGAYKWVKAINESGQLNMKLVQADKDETSWDIDLHITKNTFGPTGVVPLHFVKNKSYFRERI